MSDENKLTSDEEAVLSEYRKRRASREAAAAAIAVSNVEETFDINDIKPGMSEKDIAAAAAAIRRGLGR